jgi:hypothetical protein
MCSGFVWACCALGTHLLNFMNLFLNKSYGSHFKLNNKVNWKITCRGQPWGSPLTKGETPLKTCKKTMLNTPRLNTHTHGPRHGGPDGPPRRPTQDPLEHAPPRSRAHTSLGWVPSQFEGARSPRAGFASLEGLRRPRAGPASLEVAPHAHAHSRTRVRAFNALTKAGRGHHAPGTRAPVLSHQLSRREPIPDTVGDCATWPVPAP